jgi:hypothetical protein
MRWTGVDSTGASLRAVHGFSAELAKEFPRGIAHVNVVESSSGVSAGISEGTRATILGMLRDRGLPLVSVAVVAPGTGFLSAMVRSFLTGAALLARSSATIRFFASAREVDAFLRSPAGHGELLGVDIGDVIRSVATVQGTMVRVAARS